MLPFLGPHEQLMMQLGNHFCYEAAVGRVVTYFTLRRAPIAYIFNSCKLQVYSFSTHRSSQIRLPFTNESWTTLVYSGQDLFVYSCGKGGPNDHRWLLCENIASGNLQTKIKAEPCF